MRILTVSSADYAGGAESIAHALHTYLTERGHASLMAVGMKSGADPGIVTLGTALHSAAAPAARAPRAASPASLFWPKVRRRLRRYHPGDMKARLAGREVNNYPRTNALLKDDWPELIHAHNLHGEYFDLRTLPALSQRVPVVLTLHDSWLFTGHCAQSLDCERWRHGCGSCPDLALYPPVRRDRTADNWQLKSAIYQRSQLRVAAPSQWLLDRARASSLAAGVVEWKLIPNGVDLNAFQPGVRVAARRALGLPLEGHIILTVGIGFSRNSYKDAATFFAAIRMLRERQSAHVVVVGDRSAALQERGVIALPYSADRERMQQLYQAADLYVHSARAESAPLSILEAMASGAAVVASAVGGVPEQVGDTGILVPSGDAKALAAAIAIVLTDNTRREQLAAAALQRVRQHFDLRKQMLQYEQWFEEILA